MASAASRRPAICRTKPRRNRQPVCPAGVSSISCYDNRSRCSQLETGNCGTNMLQVEHEGRMESPFTIVVGGSRPSIRRDGKIHLARQQHNLTDLTKFVLRIYGLLASSDKNYFADSGWQAFRDLIALRNQATHPKTIEDVEVSDKDIEVMQQAKDWYLKTLEDIQKIDLESADKTMKGEGASSFHFSRICSMIDRNR